MQYISIATYENQEITSDTRLAFEKACNSTVSLALQKTAAGADGVTVHAVCTAQKALKSCAIRLVNAETNWNTENYVFAPAALYNGNRFQMVDKQYPPLLTAEESKAYWGKPVLTDVPRLSLDGNGTANLNVGDLAFPCFGYFNKTEKQGYLLFFKQENELGNFGITVTENAETQTAEFILSSPCMRPLKYGMCSTKEKSDDKPATLKNGDKVTFDFTEYRFACNNIPEFLRKFSQYRSVQSLPRSHPHETPWDYAFRLIEQKYNKRNWVDDIGFYKSSESSGTIFNEWQTGWVGGAMNTLPAYILGNDESKEKTRKTLDFVFTKLQPESGFLYGIFCNGRPYGDSINAEQDIDIVLIRKDADALYYLAKLFLYMKDSGETVKPLWHEGLRKLADAFVHLYAKNGEIGQFINCRDSTIYTSGSASGSIIGAALVLCAKYFADESYLPLAKELSEHYYSEFVKNGFTNGGPGEILSAPDSESAFAVLESFVLLYRATGEQKWLHFAEDAAALCTSWCVGYDYHYKNDTQFAQRGTATTGTVWANVQNKHAAPGICTLSGESLLHLYRATGNIGYLALLRDIAHNITQFVSTPEKTMRASYVWHNKPARRQKLAAYHFAKAVRALSSFGKPMEKLLAPVYNGLYNPVGRINERVNLSDWEGKNNVGEVPIGSCWCEVSAMLTYLEIPAVYIRPAEKFCFALDHIEAEIKERTENGLTVALYNPTRYNCNYRIFTDNAPLEVPIPPENAWKAETVFLRAGERKTKHLGIGWETENV